MEEKDKISEVSREESQKKRKNKKRSRKSEEEEEVVNDDRKENEDVEMEEEKSISSESEVEEIKHEVSDGRYRNKQRCLVLSSRGVTARYRHLLEDLRKLMPHHKKDYKLDPDKSGGVSQSLTEICEVMSCTSYMYMECRKKMDAYLWIGDPNGPSARFYIWNIHTMDELRLTGNCMKGSRPVLSFDTSFDTLPHLQLLKVLFSNVFGTPRGHPKSKPFVDRVMAFYYADQKIWVRNYQIVEEEALLSTQDEIKNNTSLVEIGPRFVLNPIKILSGSIRGAVLYENKTFVSPNEIRAQDKAFHAKGYETRKLWEEKRREYEENLVVVQDPLDSVFK